ncbi:hypothetical protein Tco_0951669 [Tanacetum coccineum]|uniref:Uncharacterized protein n=1 Tax=Tanacetum coccineum TaxID=301880 RepID=A0ABQ5E1I7_9ASTR
MDEHDENEEERELCDDTTRELTVFQIKRYMMIKYSFGDDEKYFAIKEDEYDDFTSTSKEACRAYQEIFRMMDEGWMTLELGLVYLFEITVMSTMDLDGVTCLNWMLIAIVKATNHVEYPPEERHIIITKNEKHQLQRLSNVCNGISERYSPSLLLNRIVLQSDELKQFVNMLVRAFGGPKVVVTVILLLSFTVSHTISGHVEPLSFFLRTQRWLVTRFSHMGKIITIFFHGNTTVVVKSSNLAEKAISLVTASERAEKVEFRRVEVIPLPLTGNDRKIKGGTRNQRQVKSKEQDTKGKKKAHNKQDEAKAATRGTKGTKQSNEYGSRQTRQANMRYKKE